MSMEMTIGEKDLLLAQIISEHFSTQKNNLVYIPVEHLQAKGLDLSDSRNALWRMKDSGVIKQSRHCWGSFEIEEGKKIFVVTSEEESKTDEDSEVYEVEVIPGRLAQATKSTKQKTKTDGKTLVHLNVHGDLYREPKDKFCYAMSGKGVPIKILKYFADNPNADYELDTVAIAAAIGINADQLRKEINKMRSPIESNLKLKIELIEGRKNSGYRLNPNIEMVLEN